MVYGDVPLLTRVFSNLIENGIRYNRVGGTVRILVNQSGGWVTVAVIDSGIGLFLEEQSAVFDRFYRGDASRSRHTGGSGLGLSMVRQQGGNVTLLGASLPGEKKKW